MTEGTSLLGSASVFHSHLLSTLTDFSLVDSASCGLAPAQPLSLILTGFLASQVTLPSFAELWNASDFFHMVLLHLYSLPPFLLDSLYSFSLTPLGRHHLHWKCLFESLLT